MKIRDILIIVAGLVLDIITKSAIVDNFDIYESVNVIDGFFKIKYVTNTGAAWSILSGEMTFFYAITIVAIAAILYMYKTSESKIQQISFSLILAGTVGNFIDRIRLGYVVDFLDFIIFGYDFPVFNVADICLVVGCGLLILSLLLEKDSNNGKV